MPTRLFPDDRLLFAGDSVTDAGRREDPDALGNGWVRDIASALDSCNVSVVNAGIGGDRVVDLKKRWQQDVTEQRAEVLTLLIGINDTWRRYDSNEPTSAADFEEDYRYLLDRTPAGLKQLVLVQPFVLPVTAEQERWSDDLAGKQAVVQTLAKEYGAILIQADLELGRQAEAIASGYAGAAALAADGVHPTALGHRKLAELWLETVLD